MVGKTLADIEAESYEMFVTDVQGCRDIRARGRKVRPTLFSRADRKQCDLALFGGLIHFRPTQIAEGVFLRNSLWLMQGHAVSSQFEGQCMLAKRTGN